MSGTKAGNQDRPKPKPEDFVFGKMIGEGSFSYVFLARDANVPVPGIGSVGSNSDSAKPGVKFREYAIKVCEKAKIIKESKQKYVYSERDILATITKHFSPKVPFFVVLNSTFQDTRNFYFCMTFAKNGDLLKCIDKMAERDIDCVQFYAAEILAAIEFLHFKVGVIHRDLKPENVLLDEKMHILITDFGSAKFLKEKYNINNNKSASESRGIGPSGDSDTSDSDAEASSRPELAERRKRRPEGSEDELPPRPKRKSFVGTAQYVSPEILRSRGSSRASDLWAIGCVIYQMITGLPPFQAKNEYQIFKKIEKLEYSFQEGFNDDARDLIKRLLIIEPSERLGAKDKRTYRSLREHPFFKGADFDNLAETPSPALDLVRELYGNQPGAPDPIWAKDPDAKPGASRLTMLMLRDGGCTSSNSSCESLSDQQSGPLFLPGAHTSSDRQPSTSTGDPTDRLTKRNNNNVLQSQNFSESERVRSFRDQKETNKYHKFVENNLILKSGILHKKMGLFARRRMFLLTEGPRLYYVDPDKMVLKGQVPLSKSVRMEIKDPRIFFLHTPNRIYYLLDPSSNAKEWSLAIEEVRDRYFGPPEGTDHAQSSTSCRGGDESHGK